MDECADCFQNATSRFDRKPDLTAAREARFIHILARDAGFFSVCGK